VAFAWMGSAESCIVLRKTQRASSEVTDFTTTASATGGLKSVCRWFNSGLGHHSPSSSARPTGAEPHWRRTQRFAALGGRGASSASGRCKLAVLWTKAMVGFAA
jgi:hypothetical protein